MIRSLYDAFVALLHADLSDIYQDGIRTDAAMGM
jgi:hypothetical protein